MVFSYNLHNSITNKICDFDNNLNIYDISLKFSTSYAYFLNTFFNYPSYEMLFSDNVSMYNIEV